MSTRFGWALKSAMALGLAGSLMTAVTLPARAGGGAIAAGIIGGTALGVLAGAAIANSPPPPPPGYYYPPPPPPPAYYDPAADAGPPPGPGPDGPGPRCAKWRSQPDQNGNPVCLHYFQN
jgi:hypothetical protein